MTSDDNSRGFLIDAIAWQETLLQSYRSLHVTIQSILLAVGVGVAIAALTVAPWPDLSAVSLVCAVLLSCLAALQQFSASAFSGVVTARGQDINWWHEQLILAESGLAPDARLFTKFKIHQQCRRRNAQHLEDLFLQARPIAIDPSVLIGKGLGHTRRVIDRQLFRSISLIWILLLIVVWSGPVAAGLQRLMAF